MADNTYNVRGSSFTSPEKSHAGRDPPSPGKKRMVASDGTPVASIRLVSRGCTESDDEVEVIRTQVTPATVSREQQRVLDISASRKRKTLVPSQAPIVIIPSPTTNIARRIDSIRLDTKTISTPPPAATEHTMNIHRSDPIQIQQGSIHQQEHMETNAESSSPCVSPYTVPIVGKNIEVPISNDEAYMEQYLQRPEQSSNMKRLISEDEDEEEQQVNSDENVGTNNKRTKSVPVKVTKSIPDPLGNKATESSVMSSTAIRLPTITTPLSGSYKKLLSTSPSTNGTKLQQNHQPIMTFPTTTLPPMTTLVSPFQSPKSMQATPTFVAPPTTTASPSQNKAKSFSINDLLAKEPQKQQQQQQQISPYPYFNSTLLLLYNNWLAVQHSMRQQQLFQGEPAESDSTTVVLPSVRTSPSSTDDTTKSSPSVVQANSNRYSPCASPITATSSSTVSATSTSTVVPVSATGSSTVVVANGMSDDSTERSLVVESSNAVNSVRGNEGKQNALLQVSEAHLAILPDDDGDTPLHLAIIQENIPLTFYLVRLITGVSMNLDIANNLRQTPLHLAVITCQPMLAHLLVQAGASVNYPDRRGNTSVHLAVQRKNVNILQILSQAETSRPDYNARNFAGLTPVHVATREGTIDVLKFLFQMGANKNMADSCSGRTSLHYAVEAQNFQMCNFLLENGCNVNAVTFSGNTPLHVAAGRRLKEIVALLMAYGANPAIANGEGDFPSDLPASLLMQRAKLNAR